MYSFIANSRLGRHFAPFKFIFILWLSGEGVRRALCRRKTRKVDFYLGGQTQFVSASVIRSRVYSRAGRYALGIRSSARHPSRASSDMRADSLCSSLCLNFSLAVRRASSYVNRRRLLHYALRLRSFSGPAREHGRLY